jgi:hypothetical protein
MLKNKTKTTAQKLTFGNKNFYYLLLILFISFSNNLIAQNIISIPFSNGFVGDNAANNKSINSKYLTALGWSNIQFSQNSPQFIFVAQGNDIPGTILITDNSGVEYGIPGFIKWRAPSGGNITTPVFQPTSGATLATNSSNGSATYSITTLSYIGLTYNGNNLVIPTTGSNAGEVTGNAATQGILDSLNAYLGTFPSITITDYSVNESIGTKVITVTLSATSSQTVSVNFNTANNTALSGSDYNSQTGTLTFTPGQTSKTITLTILDDLNYETDETFYVQLSDATNASILDPSSTITIVNDDLPTITKTGTLTAFTSCSGSVSAEQSFSVSGVNLVSDIIVTAPTGYEVSLTSGSSFAGFVTLTPSSNTVNSTAIYVRLKNNASNSATGNIVCSATNATSVNVSTGSATVNALPTAPSGTNGSSANAGTVSISGSVNSGETIDWYANSTGGSPLSGGTGTANFTTPSISSTTIYYAQARNTTTGCVSATRTAVTASISANATPTITTSGTLNPFSSCLGSVSSEQSFTVSGIDLAADIVVTAPAGYEISLTSGGTFLSSITLTQVSSTVGATTIYVRLKNDASNGVSGNISCTSTNATTQDVTTGTATVSNPPSITTNAINFDGSNDYVLSNVSGTALTTFSIEMYVKPLSNQNAKGIFQWTDQTSSGIPMVLFQQTGSTLRVFVDSNYNLTTTILIGSWSHIALTYDGSIYKLYLNGALVNSYTGGIQFQNLATKLFYGNGYNGYWNGSMDEARVWSTARTQAEIQQFMNSELVGTESGLLSYFKFNQGTANENNIALSTVTDSSSNNVSGSFNNMALTGTSSNFVAGIMTNNSISAMNQNVCLNGSATALTSSLSGGSGLTYQWYSNSTSSNTGGTLIANATSSSFTPPTNQIGTTYYYVVVTNSSGCESPSTVSGAISVNAVPTIALSSSSNNVTYSANSQTTTISYSGSTGSPTTYSISWNANPSNSFAAVANANLSSSPITIDVPAGTNNGTYTGTLTVTNASNCTSSNSSFTVTVNNGDVTAPTITYPTSQNNNSSLKISENTTSVTTFTANEQVTWSITGGSERTLFSINSSGLLTFNNAPSFASPTDSSPTNSYIVEVTATDSSGNFSRQMLTVFISPLCGNWNN